MSGLFTEVHLEAVSEAPVRFRTAINAVAPATGWSWSAASTKTRGVHRDVDYHIKSAARVCAATGRNFQPGEHCHSVLVERDGQMLRLDYAADAWQGPPEDSLGDWITIVPDDGAKSQTLDTESLFRYFEQLCEDANPAQHRFAFVGIEA